MKIFFIAIITIFLFSQCTEETIILPQKLNSDTNWLKSNDGVTPDEAPVQYAVHLCQFKTGEWGYQCYGEGSHCNTYLPQCQHYGTKIVNTSNNQNFDSDFISNNYTAIYELFEQGILNHPDIILKDMKTK